MSLINAGEAAHNATGHGDRPWVYFMVDCFFLIVEFFMLTFKLKQEEAVLPQRLPPDGGGHGPCLRIPVMVDVSRTDGSVCYRIGGRDAGQPVALEELSDRLTRMRVANKDCLVKISYQALVHWDDVMAVYNACKHAGVAECGLVPMKGR